MGLTKQQRINEAIELLTAYGYIVKKDYSSLIGKWVSFWKPGMLPVLHGRVIDEVGKNDAIFKVKCKNSCYRFVHMDNVIEFHDNKQDCYAIKNIWN